MLNAAQLKKIQKELETTDARVPVMLNILGDWARFRIFSIFMQHKGICVTELAKILNISIPAVSQHLKILERSGLVTREKMGKMVCYRLKESDRLVKLIMRFIQINATSASNS